MADDGAGAVHVPGKEHLTAYALEAAAHALRFFSQWFGIDYPADKLDLLAGETSAASGRRTSTDTGEHPAASTAARSAGGSVLVIRSSPSTVWVRLAMDPGRHPAPAASLQSHGMSFCP